MGVVRVLRRPQGGHCREKHLAAAEFSGMTGLEPKARATARKRLIWRRGTEPGREEAPRVRRWAVMMAARAMAGLGGHPESCETPSPRYVWEGRREIPVTPKERGRCSALAAAAGADTRPRSTAPKSRAAAHHALGPQGCHLQEPPDLPNRLVSPDSGRLFFSRGGTLGAGQGRGSSASCQAG